MIKLLEYRSTSGRVFREREFASAPEDAKAKARARARARGAQVGSGLALPLLADVFVIQLDGVE